MLALARGSCFEKTPAVAGLKSDAGAPTRLLQRETRQTVSSGLFVVSSSRVKTRDIFFALDRWPKAFGPDYAAMRSSAREAMWSRILSRGLRAS